jgi:sugar lactone lactonase YvrE
MKKQISSIMAALACGLAALPLRAELIQGDGILGNSGEQGATLVRFNAADPALGLGVVADRYGTLWDRAGAGRLNRYAADGRLLASYRIPAERSSFNDTIAATGDNLILCVDGGLHTLSIDAPAGSTSTPLKIDADHMALSSHNGWVVASKGPAVFLANAAGAKKPVVTLQGEPWQLETGPDGAVYVVQEGKAYRVADTPGGAVWVGTVPGDRTQFLGGFLYGAGWQSTLRRFDTAWQPAPGVVLGGNSGSFIGHVDEQSEVVNPRGLAKVGPDLFAVSGFSGILHLLQWREQEKRLVPLRRIGSTASCPALALDREGRTWRLSGNWNWNDGPATPLHFGIPEPEIVFALAMQSSDSVVGYGRMWGKPSVLFGKLDKEIRIDRIETPTILPKEGPVAVAVAEQNNRRALLVLEEKGIVTAVAVSDTGQYQSDIGQVHFLTATPVKQWTSLATANRDALVAAGDGFVIVLAREGENWKETRRWNSWGPDAAKKFGGPIWLSVDAGRLWVSDSTRHRVVCFDPASGRELAAFGVRDTAGDDLARLDTPRVIAARGQRAVVSDSGNQRLVKLRITNK